MENVNTKITEDDLHGFVDGVLSDEKIILVEQWLGEHPDDAEKVQKWFEQNEAIQKLFVLPEENLTDISFEDDEVLIMALSKKASDAAHASGDTVRAPKKLGSGWRMMAAALPLLMVGGIVGSLLTTQFAPEVTNVNSAAYVQDLPEVSRASYTIYTAEKKHPVEVRTVDDKQHLIAWLGKRINKDLTPPDLNSKGFSLFGGRILPLEGKPSAMLMYEDAEGERLTLIIGQNKNNEDTSFSFAQKDGIQTFYWIDQEFGYAISGKMSRVQMEAIANEIYKQL